MESKLLLQVDLEGHSAYMAAHPSKPDAAQSRVEYATVLHKMLDKSHFSLLSWKGDGGVYAADPPTSGRPADFAVRAAEKAAAAFHVWRAKRPDRDVLRFRISLHWAPDLYTYPERGYWSSDHLNFFMKYEREIGLSGTVAVTDKVFSHLSGNCQQRFGRLLDFIQYCVQGVFRNFRIVAQCH